jgi:hypothetical protein
MSDTEMSNHNAAVPQLPVKKTVKTRAITVLCIKSSPPRMEYNRMSNNAKFIHQVYISTNQVYH